MAYEKQTWQTGDVITQEKLNHMEDGIADAGGDSFLNDVMWINFTTNDGKTFSADKTYQQVQEQLFTNGKPVGARANWKVISLSPTVSSNAFSFSNSYKDNDRLCTETYILNSDDTVTYEWD